MKPGFFLTIFLFFSAFSCRKSNDCHCPVLNKCATIVQVASHCNSFGIKVNGMEYPSANIPVQFQVVGMKVCVNYNLYEDLRLCVCCGGTWADIKNMSSQ